MTKEFIPAMTHDYFRPRVFTYLHNHVFSTRFSIIAICLLLYHIISNQKVSGYVIVKDFILSGLLLTSILMLYGLIRSTKNMSQGMYSDSFSG